MALLISIIVLAFIFDYINGFHDAANSIATIVSTKVLTPFQAVLWAAFFNFVAYFIASHIIGDFGIANTVAKTVYAEFITLPVILSGIIAAIVWNLLTWWLGIPSSSSHTLIGGFAGAAIAATTMTSGSLAAGFAAIQGSVIMKIAAFIVLAPVIGMIMAFLLTLLVLNICKKANPHRAEAWFKHLQLVSSALFSIGHGLNDSQKVMGIIGAAVIAAGAGGLFNDGLPEWMEWSGLGHIQNLNDMPAWIPLGCFTVIALGTMSGGWKIVKTMGSRITKVTPLEGMVAETAGALTLYLTELLKIPVSTTHTITGAIIGVGATKRLAAVRWGVTRSLLIAWILTIPVSAALAAAIYMIVNACVG
jgi:PiT family inorganic phosphate transporter